MKRYAKLTAGLVAIAALVTAVAAFAGPEISGPLMGRILKLERAIAALVIGVDVQAYDADLADLADGSLTASKVGNGLTDAQVADDITLTSTKACSAGSLTTTGVVTFAKTAVASNVQAAALSNLPVGSTTNAAFIKIRVGTTTYALPAYAQP